MYQKLKEGMTEGELLLLKMKTARERRSISAVIRQAVAKYESMQSNPTCARSIRMERTFQ